MTDIIERIFVKFFRFFTRGFPLLSQNRIIKELRLLRGFCETALNGIFIKTPVKTENSAREFVIKTVIFPSENPLARAVLSIALPVQNGAFPRPFFHLTKTRHYYIIIVIYDPEQENIYV